MIPDRALTAVQRTIVTRLLDGPATTREIRALLPTSGPESVRGSLRILARQGRVETIGHRWSTPDPATWALMRRIMDNARRDPALITATRLAPAWGRPAQGWSITDEGRALLHDRERLRGREAET